MKNSASIWNHLIAMSQEFEEYLLHNNDDDDLILDAYERFLEDRAPLIDDLVGLKEKPDQSIVDRLYDLDIKIQSNLKSWMKETKKSMEELKLQRESIIKMKRTQGGYDKRTLSQEGYFIDRKK